MKPLPKLWANITRLWRVFQFYMKAELLIQMDPELLSNLVKARLGAGTHEDRMKAYRKLPPGKEGDAALNFADQLAKSIAETQEPRRSSVAP